MTDGYSVSTTRLRALSDGVQGVVTGFRETYVPEIERLTIPASELPLLDGGFSAAYDRLQDAISAASTSLADSLEAVHTELAKVVDRYETLEEQHGHDFDESLAN